MFEDLQIYVPNQTRVSAKDMNTLGALVRFARNISADNLFLDSSGAYFRKGAKALDGFWIVVSDHIQDGLNKRYLYSWAEVEKASSGYGGWGIKSNGRSGPDDTWGYFYNGAEDMNGTTGLMGNGTTAPYPGSFDLQPLPNGYRAFVRIVRPKDGGKPELWLDSPNAIDGSCT